MRERRLHRPLTLLLLLPLAASAAEAGRRLTLDLPQTSLSEEERIVHVLNRFGFGPRPGDVDRVRALGLEAYLELQLDPEQIPDGEVERRLADFETLEMTTAELLVAYPPPELLRGIERNLSTRMGMDPAAKGALFPELGTDARTAGAGKSKKRKRYLEGPARVVTELSQAKLVRAVYSERQLQEVLTDFWFNHFNVFIGKGAERWLTTSYERDAIRPHVLGEFRELLGATAQAPAMLFYLDNWLSAGPGSDVGRRELQPYATKAIREQGMPTGGVATLILRDRGHDTRELERSLLTYETMVANMRHLPSRIQAMKLPGLDTGPPRKGLNENYARELLELHTLGVDSGYTQEDIIAVARILTGWTLLPMHAGQGFVFVPEQHDTHKNKVLGRKIKGKGQKQGEVLLDRLAEHASTARFVSTKIAVRFVSDDPPETLVQAMTETFLQTGGDIRQVLIRMINSPEFWAPETVRAKVKTPLELVASAVRATGGEIADLPLDRGDPEAMGGEMERYEAAPGLLYTLRQLGQPLYGAQPPTGYDETAEHWISTGALLDRMKLGLGLAGNKVPGVRIATPPPIGLSISDPRLTALGRSVLGTTPSPETIEAIEAQLSLDPRTLEEMGVPRRFARSEAARSTLALGWFLASAEFQRR